MAAIVTLSMNPALDIATSVDAIVPTDKMRCGPPRYDPGGGGVNVARVVHILGGDAVAVVPIGGPAGLALHNLLDRDGVKHRVVSIRGPTRESFTVDERRSGKQYRFVLPGPELSEAEQQNCLDQLAQAARNASFVVASGSLPPGIEPGFFERVAKVASDVGARFVLDTSGKALRHMRRGVFLLKPSIRELRELVGRELRDESEQVAAGRELIDQRVVEVVVISLGAQGALLVSKKGHERLAPIEVPVRSTVGAGDSMVAAITLGLVRDLALRDAVRFGMAAGAATVMTPGTELCRREDVERLYAAS